MSKNCKLGFLTVLAIVIALVCSSARAQGLLRDRLRQKLGGQGQGLSSLHNFNPGRNQSDSAEKINMAGLNVAVWQPANNSKPAPLVIFSHGFHGMNTQSIFLMKALASDGYLVMAPNHRDAMMGGGGEFKPEVSFKNASAWSDRTYRQRGDDIAKLLQFLHNDPAWTNKIDWSKVALAGHSLGGYTALALAGAWPSWKLPDIKAVLALSPYSEPFVVKGTLKDLHVPVMYQGGTRDFGITPFLKRPNGSFSQTSSPAYFVEFDKVGHFSFSNLNKDPASQELICHYSVAFLDKYVRNQQSPTLDDKESGVIECVSK